MGCLCALQHLVAALVIGAILVLLLTVNKEALITEVPFLAPYFSAFLVVAFAAPLFLVPCYGEPEERKE